MKIKLHNSLGKVNENSNRYHFLFNEKIFVSLSEQHFLLTYRIDDKYCFLVFFFKTKEFEEWFGFGSNRKNFLPKWFKGPVWNWTEI